MICQYQVGEVHQELVQGELQVLDLNPMFEEEFRKYVFLMETEDRQKEQHNPKARKKELILIYKVKWNMR
jgi:hypothetical protein